MEVDVPEWLESVDATVGGNEIVSEQGLDWALFIHGCYERAVEEAGVAASTIRFKRIFGHSRSRAVFNKRFSEVFFEELDRTNGDSEVACG